MSEDKRKAARMKKVNVMWRSDSLAFIRSLCHGEPTPCHAELAPARWRACEPYGAGSWQRVSASKRRKAFTLAEVLITLAIIGVVAALTIPTVINNYQKTQTVTRLKKIHSALANTTNLAIAEHGPIQNWEVGNQNRDASNAFVKTYLAPYLKIAKMCETQIDGECKFTVNGLNKTSLTRGSAWTRLYLNDGTFMCLITYNYEYEGGMLKQADIYVDINGQRPPNTWGKDVFPYVYYIDRPDSPDLNGKLMPFGMQNSRSTSLNAALNGCNKGASGFYCGSIIVKDGWEIKDDYPW